MGKILLFYKYVTIEYPKRIVKWQKSVCTQLGLKGRVLIAHEGINGTLGGSVENIERYKQLMKDHELFADIDYKESDGNADCFPRLAVLARPEAVHLGLDTQKVSCQDSGTHLAPEQTHQLLQEKPKDLVVFDARNSYEWAIGKFEGAVTPDIQNFRELPAYIDQHLEQFKDKQVLMYCTGGIRCERASTYLKSKGIAKHVYQMDGGIHRYAEQFPDGFFRGKNYVFDARVAVRINNDVIGTCSLCPAASDEYYNCINASCNEHFIACDTCIHRLEDTCSTTCQQLVASGAVKKRAPFNKIDTTACSLPKTSV